MVICYPAKKTNILTSKNIEKNWHSRPEQGSPWLPTFSSIQLSHSVVSDSATPWIAARQASLSITNSWSLLKLMSIELVRPSNHLTLCHPLLLLPSIFPSIRVFSNESALRIRWPKYWLEFQLQHQSLQWTPRTDLLQDGLVGSPCQGTLKSFLQHHSSKSTILRPIFNMPVIIHYCPIPCFVFDNYKHLIKWTNICIRCSAQCLECNECYKC